ncbi:hypothetical protein M1M38_gp069 [Halorubrum tailed virus 27]|uniref:Uncharacterized protein n=1 Tax=Halorubrum tailed virus 27 TaxID=2878008 RepID=A0AAE8XZ11_9CAUD|nr:hypothetical protein M1M38_gp069 [Halorubrum tailed virus 27]UBF22762.1 hypothetical protein HRTV-27_gp69 [Halorubrum tailed virus 27]
MSNYGNYGNYGGSSKNDPILDVRVNTALRATLNGVMGTGPGQYGQQIGVTLGDVEVIDGVLMKNVSRSEEQSPKLRLWAWEDLFDVDNPENEIDPAEATAEDAPETYAHHHSKGTTYYELVSARKGSGEPGEDGESGAPENVGDFMWFESGASKPSATAKSLANVLTNMGGDALLDTSELDQPIYGWLDRGVSIRPDAQGARVEIAKVLRPGDEYDYHHPVIIDLDTMEAYGQYQPGEAAAAPTPAEPAAAPVPAGGAPVEVEGETTPAAAPGGDVNKHVDKFVTTMRDLQQTNEDIIRGQLESLIGSEATPLSEDDVEEFGGEDAVVEAVVS